jgi:hypothetical protein
MYGSIRCKIMLILELSRKIIEFYMPLVCTVDTGRKEKKTKIKLIYNLYKFIHVRLPPRPKIIQFIKKNVIYNLKMKYT